MTNIITAVPRSNRGQKLKTNSVNMSRSIARRKIVNGESAVSIAESYNRQDRRAGKTLTVQAVCQRVTTFAARFPDEFAAMKTEAATKLATKPAKKVKIAA